MTIHRVIGPPGSGKTSFIVRKIAELKESGVALSDIGFFSFSRSALQAIASKLGQGKLPPWFRTFHSLGAVIQNLGAENLLNPLDVLDNARAIPSLKTDQTRVPELLQCVFSKLSYAANAGVPFETAIRSSSIKYPIQDLFLVYQEIKKYQQDTGKLFFSDMLTIRGEELGRLPRLRYVFIDEAQDLSAGQIELARHMIAGAEHVWLVGDPNQAIHGWAGNSERWLLEYAVDETFVLEQSFRMPSEVHRYSQRIAAAIGPRFEFKPRDERGSVQVVSDLATLPYSNGESWLILSRNNYGLRPVKDILTKKGLLLTTLGQSVATNLVSESQRQAFLAYILAHKMGTIDDESERLISVNFGPLAVKNLKEGVPAFPGLGLSRQQYDFWTAVVERGGFDPIALGTFHASKGLQADNVVILPNLTKAQYRTWQGDWSSELKPFYVACTRAAKNLYFLLGTRGIPYERFM